MNALEIRVGIIRCDVHGVYYGALMDRHDPLMLRELNNTTFFYFYTQYDDPCKKTVPTVEGFNIVKVWDEDRKLAEDMSAIFGNRPIVCDTYGEVSDDVDLVFIADCNGDGSDHLKLAAPGIEKRVATFVDKPFASRLEDARKMIELTQKHKVPLMSLSILREIPHYTFFKNRFIEIEEPEFCIIKGGGTTLAGQIHAISLAQHLFGPGVDSVECMGQNPLAFIHLNYGDKKGKPCKGVMLNCDAGKTDHCSIYSSVYSKFGAIHSPGIGDFQYPFGAAAILEKVKKMVHTGEPQVPYDEIIENVAVVEAAHISQKTGRVVYLDEIL